MLFWNLTFSCFVASMDRKLILFESPSILFIGWCNIIPCCYSHFHLFSMLHHLLSQIDWDLLEPKTLNVSKILMDCGLWEGFKIAWFLRSIYDFSRARRAWFMDITSDYSNSILLILFWRYQYYKHILHIKRLLHISAVLFFLLFSFLLTVYVVIHDWQFA